MQAHAIRLAHAIPAAFAHLFVDHDPNDRLSECAAVAKPARQSGAAADETLVRDVDAGGGAGLHRQRAGSQWGAVSGDLENVPPPDARRHGAPGGASPAPVRQTPAAATEMLWVRRDSVTR